MSGFTCRPATPSDVPEIVALWLEGMAVHANLDPRFPLVADAEQRFGAYLREVLDDPKALVLVAESASHVVGYCLARVSQHPAVFAMETLRLETDAT